MFLVSDAIFKLLSLKMLFERLQSMHLKSDKKCVRFYINKKLKGSKSIVVDACRQMFSMKYKNSPTLVSLIATVFWVNNVNKYQVRLVQMFTNKI